MLEGALALLQHVLCLFSYVSGNTSFPEILTPQEEKKYLRQMAKGDEQARQKLIEHNLRLVAHIIKKYPNTGRDMEDLISIGTIGLIKGVSTYREDRGTQLATYCARCIENEILMAIRSGKKQKNETSLTDPIGTDKEGNEVSLLDILCATDNAVDEEVELRMQVQRLCTLVEQILPRRERVVVELRYGLGSGEMLTQREIAKLLGISRSYVSRIEKKALQKLALAMNKSASDKRCR